MPVADLYPLPFTTLVERLDRELERDSLYLMPRREWWTPIDGLDTGLHHLGKRIATPAGPASGPHTQMAQNLVLSFLGGGRFMELKTVQVDDELVIPRPCIFVPHIGYNVEWSQELRVHQSAREYAAGWMLLHMLTSEHGPGLWGPSPETSFDVSIGYDLAGIRSDKVRGYLESMRDASGLFDALRAELPGRLAKWAAVEVPAEIADSITISTFHGCPADEIEAIATQCLDWGWHTVVKLNPTLLGFDRCREMLDRMGYDFVDIDRGDFEKDLQWAQLLEMAARLRAHAAARGLGFGFKLTNTLVCHSERTPFYPDKGGQGEMYLSGPPLHVLSYTLAAQLRAVLGPAVPLTFSAGVDRDNFVPCVGGGLGPVTSCSDLLKGRGYGRMTKYIRSLERAMQAHEVASVDALRQALSTESAGPADAAAAHLSGVADGLLDDPRYRDDANRKAPKKVGTHLVLLDCLTCDKCIPVCPNAANFSFPVPTGTYPAGTVSWTDGALTVEPGAPLEVTKRHQIGNFADLCNDCGQCDPWCPEDGGPYIEKPTVFLSAEGYADHPETDGFLLDGARGWLKWRRKGVEYRYAAQPDGSALFHVEHGTLTLREDTPIAATGTGEVALSLPVTMRLFLESWSDLDVVTWLPPVPAAP
jgi:putative selenate reductase